MELFSIALWRRIAAVVCGLTLVFSTAASACVICLESPREGGDYAAITSIPIRNTLEFDDDVLPPDTDFTYDVAPAGATVNAAGTAVKAGVEGGVTVAGAFNFGGSSKRDDAALTVDTSVFTEPGIYRYDVTQENGGYEGIRYDDNAYHLDLFVQHVDVNDASRGLFVYTVAVSVTESIHGTPKETTVAGGSAGSENMAVPFYNYMIDDPQKVKDDAFSVHDLVITGKVEDKPGFKAKKASFTATVYGNESDVTEIFHLILTTAAGEKSISVPSGRPVDFQLGDGDTARLTGLSQSDRFEVAAVAAKGFALTVDGDADTVEKTAAGSTFAAVMGTADRDVVVTDHRVEVLFSDVAAAFGLYFLLAVAAVVIVILGRKFHRWRQTT